MLWTATTVKVKFHYGPGCETIILYSWDNISRYLVVVVWFGGLLTVTADQTLERQEAIV